VEKLEIGSSKDPFKFGIKIGFDDSVKNNFHLIGFGQLSHIDRKYTQKFMLKP